MNRAHSAEQEHNTNSQKQGFKELESKVLQLLDQRLRPSEIQDQHSKVVIIFLVLLFVFVLYFYCINFCFAVCCILLYFVLNLLFYSLIVCVFCIIVRLFSIAFFS